jgi:hypothetical protein
MICIGLLASGVGGSTSAAPSALSVCELAANLQKLDGQAVRVRGEIDADRVKGGVIFNGFAGIDCAGSDGKQVRVAFDMPDVSVLQTPPPGYRFNSRSVSRAARLVRSDQGGAPRRIEGTVEGILYGSVATGPSEQKGRREHGDSSAHILVAAIVDVEIR